MVRCELVKQPVAQVSALRDTVEDKNCSVEEVNPPPLYM